MVKVINESREKISVGDSVELVKDIDYGLNYPHWYSKSDWDKILKSNFIDIDEGIPNVHRFNNTYTSDRKYYINFPVGTEFKIASIDQEKGFISVLAIEKTTKVIFNIGFDDEEEMIQIMSIKDKSVEEASTKEVSSSVSTVLEGVDQSLSEVRVILSSLENGKANLKDIGTREKLLNTLNDVRKSINSAYSLVKGYRVRDDRKVR